MGIDKILVWMTLKRLVSKAVTTSKLKLLLRTTVLVAQGSPWSHSLGWFGGGLNRPEGEKIVYQKSPKVPILNQKKKIDLKGWAWGWLRHPRKENPETHTAPSARRAPQAESKTDDKEASNYPCDNEFSPQEDISTMNILSRHAIIKQYAPLQSTA